MHNILVIDDDRGIRDLLKAYLNKNGFNTDIAENSLQASALLKNNKYDLIVSDVMMPGEDGISFMTRYKESGGETPIILLTAMNRANDRIEGLESGADDYLTKPFEPKELELRIKKLIDRFSQTKTKDKNDIFKFSEFEFNLQNRLLTRHGQRISLSSKESELLYIFIQNLGTPISREKLADNFNGISERSIDVQVTRLRHKIEEDSKKPKFIQTDWGKGYVFRA